MKRAATVLGTLAMLGGGMIGYRRYRRELTARRDALRVARVVATAAGPIEFAEEGAGFPVLAIHGAGGGHDQGLAIARTLFGRGYRLIAPSRFGYLGTPVPDDPAPGRQAEAHAALLDALGIGRAIVVAASAGAPSAIELALRRPERVAALVLLVPLAYAPASAMGAPHDPSSRLVLGLVERGADLAFWLASGLARPWVVRFLGVSPRLEANAEPAERARVSAMIRDILPLSARIDGLAIDGGFVPTPRPLEGMQVPLLVFTARDDLFGSQPGAEYTAARVPDAELHVLAQGGHLLVGQGAAMLPILASFLARRAPEAAPLTPGGGFPLERPLERGE